jgi:predicted RNA-binding protein YlxR (DUF448 family)
VTRRKHKPQRMCIACRTVKDKRDLIRVVRTPEQQIILDRTGKANGRGVYLCNTSTCLEKGLKPERLSHTLKCVVTNSSISAIKDALLQTEFTNQ